MLISARQNILAWNPAADPSSFPATHSLKVARIITEFIFLKCDYIWLQISVKDPYWHYVKLKTAFPWGSNGINHIWRDHPVWCKPRCVTDILWLLDNLMPCQGALHCHTICMCQMLRRCTINSFLFSLDFSAIKILNQGVKKIYSILLKWSKKYIRNYRQQNATWLIHSFNMYWITCQVPDMCRL